MQQSFKIGIGEESFAPHGDNHTCSVQPRSDSTTKDKLPLRHQFDNSLWLALWVRQSLSTSRFAPEDCLWVCLNDFEEGHSHSTPCAQRQYSRVRPRCSVRGAPMEVRVNEARQSGQSVLSMRSAIDECGRWADCALRWALIKTVAMTSTKYAE